MDPTPKAPAAEATIRELADGTRVYVVRGGKVTSSFDFIVKSKGPYAGDFARTPSHTHLVVDMFMKRMGNPFLTNKLVDHLLTSLIAGARPASAFPPAISKLSDTSLERFAPLNAFGEFSVEYILVIEELIAIAERTNYPSGTLQKSLWTTFREGSSLYTVLGAALYRGSR